MYMYTVELKLLYSNLPEMRTTSVIKTVYLIQMMSELSTVYNFINTVHINLNELFIQ